MTSAIVVGAGPNGLASAVTLARRGIQVTVLEASSRIGGGTRSAELTTPGLVHDECSAFHPLVFASEFYAEAGLDRYGLEWCWPEVQYAHPLDGGRGAAARRSVDDTAAKLGSDAGSWRRTFGPAVRDFDQLGEDIMGPVLGIPSHPFKLARFGMKAALPASWLARRWSTPEAQALFGGVAAHAMRPLGQPFASSIGFALASAAHAYGWPVAKGGSGQIASALEKALIELGGRIETGVTVTSLDNLPEADIVMLDVAPAAAARIAGDRMPSRVAAAYRRYQHGPGAFKVDFAVEGGVPWSHHDSRLSGTVHLGGSFQEINTTETQVSHGEMPERPFVLVGQQALADPSRGTGTVKPLYSYAHVPHGFEGDATEAITAQIERFAPGFRERIIATHVRTTTEMSRQNANYVGGDITTGANMARQLIFRPRVTLSPYSTGIDGVYLCSAATPPGAGAHGMCGYRAAMKALSCL